MKKNKFTMINEEGIEVEYDVLFSFDSDETKKQYIAYTDHTKTESGAEKVYASIYEDINDGKELNLTPIQTDKEWKMIETILKSIQEEINKKDAA